LNRGAVEASAGQTQKFGLEWQKSNKSDRAEALKDILTPLFPDN